MEYQCGKKIRYPNEKSAKLRARYLERNQGIYLSTYRCPWCSRFHLGNSPYQKKGYWARLGFQTQ